MKSDSFVNSIQNRNVMYTLLIFNIFCLCLGDLGILNSLTLVTRTQCDCRLAKQGFHKRPGLNKLGISPSVRRLSPGKRRIPDRDICSALWYTLLTIPFNQQSHVLLKTWHEVYTSERLNSLLVPPLTAVSRWEPITNHKPPPQQWPCPLS